MKHTELHTDEMPRADVVVQSDLTGENVNRLREAVEDAIANGICRLIVDLSDAGCLEPEAFGFLAQTAQQLSNKGGWIKLLSGHPVKRLVDIAVVDAPHGELVEVGA